MARLTVAEFPLAPETAGGSLLPPVPTEVPRRRWPWVLLGVGVSLVAVIVAVVVGHSVDFAQPLIEDWTAPDLRPWRQKSRH